jgi:hypothetical protein
MTRILLTLLCGLVLTGCSRGDLREVAENVRVRAEGVGAQAEARRMNARMEAAGDGGYASVQMPEPPKAEPEKAAEPEKPKPPPTVYVVVPVS